MGRIDRLKNLPHREGMRTRYRDGSWDRHYWHSQKIGDYTPWTLKDRVCENFIGKPFDEAFSYFCTLVPKHLQCVFLEEFDDRFYRFYDIDDDGNIQESEYGRRRTRSKKVYFSSIDYEYDITYWKNGEKIKPGRWGYGNIDYDEKKIEVVSGYCLEFSSRNDPEFKRLMAEKMQQLRKLHREWKIEEEERFNLRVEQLRQQEKEEKEKQAEVDRERLGFDENSFFGEEYHGQKRKKK
jgi:hypothetical protein